VRHADIVGLSFAQSADDVRVLRQRLAALGAAHLGMILKIETRRGFEHLPDLLLAAMAGPATGVMIATGKSDLKRTVVSPRYYLADAAFLVGLEGADTALLTRIHDALRNPVWPLALGRKSFPPSCPVWLPDGLVETDLKTGLSAAPRIAQPLPEHQDRPLRLILEHAREGAVRLDQPIAPFSLRRFGPRFVSPEVIDVSR
jgi:CRISPR system Cascade subunit CasD